MAQMNVLRWLFGEWQLKLAALVAALALWTNAVLERTYETTFRVPVVVPRASDSLRVVGGVDFSRANVTVEARGKELLVLRFLGLKFRPTIPEGRAGARRIKLVSADLKLPPGVRVTAIDPEEVEIAMTPASRREAAVLVPTRGTPPGEQTLLGIRPLSKVRVFGPEADVGLISTVRTETLDLTTVTRTGVVRLAIARPRGEGLAVSPETVDVEVLLEREAARILLDVPVRVLAPSSIRVTVDPGVAQVAIAGPASRVDSLRSGDIRLVIKVSTLAPGTHRLPAEVSELPEGFRLVKCEPQLFDVEVR